MWTDTYLAALSKGALPALAAKAAGVSAKAVAAERTVNPAFADAADAIMEEQTDTLEMEAIRRARDGVAKPVFYKGVMIDEVTEHSDSLLQFLLKGRRRDVYGDKREISGGDAPLSIALRDLEKEYREKEELSGPMPAPERVLSDRGEADAKTQELLPEEDVSERRSINVRIRQDAARPPEEIRLTEPVARTAAPNSCSLAQKKVKDSPIGLSIMLDL